MLHHFLGEEDLKWLTRFDRYGLDDNQKKAQIFLREAGAVNNLVFRQLSGVDTLHASAALREMRDEGIIAQKGAGNATYYVPGEILLQKRDETLHDNEARLLDNEARLLDNEARLLDNGRIEKTLEPLKKRLNHDVLDQIVAVDTVSDYYRISRLIPRISLKGRPEGGCGFVALERGWWRVMLGYIMQKGVC